MIYYIADIYDRTKNEIIDQLNEEQTSINGGI